MNTYSQIISAKDYNDTISNQHLYINQADHIIFNLIKEKIQSKTVCSEVVELGCGPGRLLPLIATLENIYLTGVDHDEIFLSYAKELTQSISVNLQLADIPYYIHPKPGDIFYSQGVHHHISKGVMLQQYLANVYHQLSDEGWYIISDEFLPDYKDEEERCHRLIIWYSHIIAHALNKGFTYLAEEEAKTLLDDLQEGGFSSGVKAKQQVKLILDAAPTIDISSVAQQPLLCKNLLDILKATFQVNLSHDKTMDLSRHDYKISEQVFIKEMADNGFEIITKKIIGPLETKGAMGVYVARRQQ